MPMTSRSSSRPAGRESLVLQFLVLAGAQGADAAQHVGGVVGVVLPNGAGGDHRPLVVPVVEDGDQLHGHVRGKDVGGGVHNGPHRQLIADADDLPGLLHGEGGVDLKVVPQQPQQGVGTGPGVGELQLLQGLVGEDRVHVLLRRLLLRPAAADQKVGKAAAGGGVGVEEGVGVGGLGGDGQGVHPRDTVLLTQMDEAQDRLVLVRPSGELGAVEGDVEHLPVAHQHLAVAVGDHAPAGLHRL